MTTLKRGFKYYLTYKGWKVYYNPRTRMSYMAIRKYGVPKLDIEVLNARGLTKIEEKIDKSGR